MKGKNKALFKKTLSLLLILAFVAAYVPFWENRASAAAAPDASSKVTINNVTSAEGFTHPGIGLTKEVLDNMREQVIAKKEPWYSYYVAMTKSVHASTAFSSANQTDASDPTKPRSLDFNSQSYNSRFITDGLRAYTQALMYYITGDATYRYNAMRIIRTWSRLDPTQYQYFTDAHIHTGIPLNRMVTAAEILRYSTSEGLDPALEWTEADTNNFTTNLITPVIETFQHYNGYFMNQHLYPLIGAMSGYIFTNNTERYAEGVEWFTVNASALDQGQNGSIKQLFRLVTKNEATGEPVDPPVVQHVEMGRDQAHGTGDLTNAEILSRLLEAQGTKVDPEVGTVSTAQNAVTAYEFLGNRILAASDFFARFMQGYDTPWITVASHTDAEGNPTVFYRMLAEGYRGRIGGNVYGQYYYYKYKLGLDLEKAAPYYAEMFKKRHYFYWESPDGGADYWMFIPKEAEGEGASTLPKVSPTDWNEIEYRTTSLDQHSSIKQEGESSYVQIEATEEGSRIAVIASSTSLKTVAFKVRTNGAAKLQINGWSDDVLVLPDTKGQWKYVTFTMNDIQGLSELYYFKVTGAGTLVDIDHMLLGPASQLTPPVFKSGKQASNLFTYVGSETTLQYDLSATDSGKNDSVTYQIENKPEGAVFNEASGAFSWKPKQAGTYPLIVSATDGTAVTAKSVSITVSNDRQSALKAVVASYDPAQKYVHTTLDAYQAIYDDAISSLENASDNDFYEKLSSLYSAVQGLQLLTPLMQDGSMDYTNMGVTSTFGTQIFNLADGSPDSFAGYYLTGDQSFTVDFGSDYKVSATAVKLQVRAGFPERIGGATVYGSNDKETWTRLTPGRTIVADDLQTLDVSGELQNNRYRFLKLHMNDNPSGSMFELSELRIIGERHETYNKLESVSIISQQSVQGRVNTGDMVSVYFKSTEPISDVRVAIQGQQATIVSPDQKSWTAFVPMDTTMPAGKVRFTIDYKTSKGVSPDTAIFTTDNSSLYYVNKSGFLNVSKLAAVVASSAGYGSGGLPAEQVGYLLFDGNTATAGDLASGTGAYYTADFGDGASVRLNGVILMPRSGQAARLNGVVVQGSNDNASWTDLTPPVSGAADNMWTYIGEDQIKDNGAYRYLKIFNSSAWYGNIAEVEFYGEYDIPSIDSKVLGPEGYTRLSYYLYKQEADRILNAFNQPGANKLVLLNELVEAGKLLVSTATMPAEKIEVSQVMVVASHKSWKNPTDNRAENGFRAFDGSIATFTDNDGNPGWINVDLGAGNEKALSSFRFYPRNPNKEHITRVNGAILQGSADGETFVDLHTISGVSTAQWYNVAITSNTPFRYLRYYSATGGANVAELEFYEKVIDKTLLAHLLEQADELNSELYTYSSLMPFNQALEAAIAVNHSSGSTQEQVDNAATQLQTAQGNLKYKTGVPLIAPLPDITAEAEARLTFTVKTLNNMAGTIYSVGNLPAGASFNTSTGEFVWTPSGVQGGIYNLIFTASASGYSTSEAVKITVKGLPQIEPDVTADLTARQLYSYQLMATDPTGQPLVYQAANLPAGAAFNPSNGLFTWTPAQEDYGSHTVILTASNAKFSISQILNLNVRLHIIPSTEYTKKSYYLYYEEEQRIESEIAKPGANRQQLLAELKQAENSLLHKLSPLYASLYSFEGNLDNTFGTTAAIASGSPAYTEGKTGQGIQLSGTNNQYVQLPADQALANDEVTVTAWVYWNEATRWQRIFDFGNGTTQYMFLTPQSGNDTLRFAIKNGGGEQTVNTSQLPLNQWVHVAVALGGGSAKLYVDGAWKATAAVTIKPSDFKPSLNYIGKSQFATDPLFNGKIDEFFIYNRALSADEIVDLYNGNVKWRDDSLLELFLAVAAAIDLERYTEDKRVPLQAAMAEAQQVLDSADSTQQQIDEAADSLQQAIEQLMLIPYIESLGAVKISTVAGVPPVLPTVVDAVYNTKSVIAVPVFWNPIDPSLYSTPGSFSVTGAVYGTPLPAIADVTVVDPDAPPPPPGPDRAPPTAPTSLTASSITTSSLVLSWNASTDNVGVIGYDVYQGDNQAGTVTGDTYSYSFTGLVPNSSYTFKVFAFDEAGNHTASEAYTVKTQAVQQSGGYTGGSSGPASGTENTIVKGNHIQVKPVVKDGKAQAVVSADALGKAIANAVQDKEKRLLIDLKSGDRVSSLALELPAEAWLKAAREDGITSISIESSLASFTITADAITGIADKGKLTLTIGSVNASGLPASVSGVLADRPVYEFSLLVDGKSAGIFKDRTVEVRIPYTPGAGEQISSLVAAYLNDQGQLEIVRSSRYDAKAGALVFFAKHFSKYAVVSNPVVFTDMSSYSWAQNSLNALAARQIVEGVDSGRFAPERPVTRAEFLKIMMEAFDLVKTGYTASFTDAKNGQWYSDAVATAQAMKIVAGYEDGSFGLDQGITREEMAAMALRILTAAGAGLPKVHDAVSFHDAAEIADYAAAAVDALSEAGFIEGQGIELFAPKASTTRAEAAVLIARMMELYY